MHFGNCWNISSLDISSHLQNFIDSSHIFTNVKKEHLLPESEYVLLLLQVT